MRKTKIQVWWKRLPDTLRRSLAFVLGLLLLTVAPFIGALPGPGGIALFIAGVAVLASEFDWAENLEELIMKKAPEEVKRRWRPTPRWQVTFDVTTISLLFIAFYLLWKAIYLPVLSLTMAALAIAVFNRNRLERLKARFKRKH